MSIRHRALARVHETDEKGLRAEPAPAAAVARTWPARVALCIPQCGLRGGDQTGDAQLLADAATESPTVFDSTAETELSETLPVNVNGSVKLNCPPNGAALEP